VKILLVEDDSTSQLMLKTMLAEHQLTIVDTGEAGLESVIENLPDMVILDINLPGIDGYVTCRRLRLIEQTKSTPILFLSCYSDLEDRLQAYGAGGNDYVSKPFDINELLSKIAFHSITVDLQQQAAQELNSSHKLLIEVQTSAAKLQSISRFIQATLFCHDIDTLFHHFFKTAKEIGINCILKIESKDGIEIRSTSYEPSVLEKEILEMSRAIERIHSFGNDRAIFRWGHATLLTRKVGDMIDTLALFMDALEAGIKAVDSESKLLEQVASLEAQNTKVRKRVTDLFGQMNSELRNAILSLGLVSALDIEDEDRLQELVEAFNARIDTELNQLGQNNQTMKDLISDLRTPPPELQGLMDISTDDDDDGAMLF